MFIHITQVFQWAVQSTEYSDFYVFWFELSHCVIQYKYQKFIEFGQNTTNTLLSSYKSGNMFPLIKPSSGQFTSHTEGTFSRCAHCGIPNVYNRMTIKCIMTYWLSFIIWYWLPNSDLYILLLYDCKHLGFHNVHIYWMCLQYGLWIGLMIARWAETCCQIYRLIIKYLSCSDWTE